MLVSKIEWQIRLIDIEWRDVDGGENRGRDRGRAINKYDSYKRISDLERALNMSELFLCVRLEYELKEFSGKCRELGITGP